LGFIISKSEYIPATLVRYITVRTVQAVDINLIKLCKRFWQY